MIGGSNLVKMLLVVFKKPFSVLKSRRKFRSYWKHLYKPGLMGLSFLDWNINKAFCVCFCFGYLFCCLVFFFSFEVGFFVCVFFNMRMQDMLYQE